MSHFAVYALTRNVGIDTVPPAPPPRLQPPGILGARYSLSPPVRRERISDFAKFLQAGRVIGAAESGRVGMPRERVYTLATIYSVLLGLRIRVRVKRVLRYTWNYLISHVKMTLRYARLKVRPQHFKVVTNSSSCKIP